LNPNILSRFGQHVYHERWERHPGGGGEYHAFRSEDDGGRDAFLMVVGNHFGFVEDRPTQQPFDPEHCGFPSLQALVDKLTGDEGNRKLVEDYLSLQACHGLIRRPGERDASWVIDAAIHPWTGETLPPWRYKIAFTEKLDDTKP
jgi:hypothetical protein